MHVKCSADIQERHRPNSRDDQPPDVGKDESEIDRILEDSFPASDAPPWTLGVTSTGPEGIRTSKRHRG